MVSDAIASGNVQAINYFVAQKYIEAFKALAEGPNQKFVLMPMESAGVIGSLGGIAELAKEALDRQPGGAKVVATPNMPSRSGGG
jgi:C-terminal region of band_7